MFPSDPCVCAGVFTLESLAVSQALDGLVSGRLGGGDCSSSSSWPTSIYSVRDLLAVSIVGKCCIGCSGTLAPYEFFRRTVVALVRYERVPTTDIGHESISLPRLLRPVGRFPSTGVPAACLFALDKWPRCFSLLSVQETPSQRKKQNASADLAVRVAPSHGGGCPVPVSARVVFFVEVRESVCRF